MTVMTATADAKAATRRTRRKRVREWVFDLPLRTEGELRLFVQRVFGATVPDVRVCAGHVTPWRAFADAFFARYPVVVWKASRGLGGKSFLLSLLAAVESVALGADVTILGGSGEQSRRVLEHMRRFWGYAAAPRYMLVGDVQREMRLVGGNRVQALMASQTSVRGPHPQRLRLDEVDEMRLAILDAALGQPMSARGIASQVVISSTHQHPDGTMSEVLLRAAEQGWPVYEWCWRETSAPPTGWLSQDEIERKRAQVTAEMWRVEFDLQEPAPESRAIAPEAVERMFRRALGVFDGRAGEVVQIEAPQPNGVYVVAADWARKVDYTEIGVLRVDVRPARLVWFWKGHREPWPRMVGRFDEQARRYGVGKDGSRSVAYHDGTGLGDVVGHYMQTPARGVVMAGRRRKDMVSNVIAAVEAGDIEAPVVRSLKAELKYASVDDAYGNGHLPDGLAMLALAWMGAEEARRAPRRRVAEAGSWL